MPRTHTIYAIYSCMDYHIWSLCVWLRGEYKEGVEKYASVADGGSKNETTIAKPPSPLNDQLYITRSGHKLILGYINAARIYWNVSIWRGERVFFLLVLYIDYQHTFFSKRKYIKNNALKSVLLCIWRDCAVAICHRWWADDFITPSTNHVAFKKDVIRLDHRASLSTFYIEYIDTGYKRYKRLLL